MFRIFLAFALNLLFCATLFAESLVEGRDYVVLQKPLNVPKNSVVELFNIGCPHCASMSKILPNLFEIIPEAEFIPYHIITGAAFSSEASEVLAVALMQDKQNNIAPKDSKSYFKRTMDAYFDANFKDRKRFKNKDEFIAYGLEQTNTTNEDFKRILKDSNTQELLKIWQTSAQSSQIQGVPSFIIQGKYLILAENLKSEEDFIFKVDALLSKK